MEGIGSLMKKIVKIHVIETAQVILMIMNSHLAPLQILKLGCRRTKKVDSKSIRKSIYNHHTRLCKGANKWDYGIDFVYIEIDLEASLKILQIINVQHWGFLHFQLFLEMLQFFQFKLTLTNLEIHCIFYFTTFFFLGIFFMVLALLYLHGILPNVMPQQTYHKFSQ